MLRFHAKQWSRFFLSRSILACFDEVIKEIVFDVECAQVFSRLKVLFLSTLLFIVNIYIALLYKKNIIVSIILYTIQKYTLNLLIVKSNRDR